ncbi:hypothetical protein ADUPG1_010280, partial [Aduncisulcus paluster]
GSDIIGEVDGGDRSDSSQAEQDAEEDEEIDMDGDDTGSLGQDEHVCAVESTQDNDLEMDGADDTKQATVSVSIEIDEEEESEEKVKVEEEEDDEGKSVYYGEDDTEVEENEKVEMLCQLADVLEEIEMDGDDTGSLGQDEHVCAVESTQDNDLEMDGADDTKQATVSVSIEIDEEEESEEKVKVEEEEDDEGKSVYYGEDDTEVEENEKVEMLCQLADVLEEIESVADKDTEEDEDDVEPVIHTPALASPTTVHPLATHQEASSAHTTQSTVTTSSSFSSCIENVQGDSRESTRISSASGTVELCNEENDSEISHNLCRRIEGLRAYLEKELGFDKFVDAYKILAEIDTSDESLIESELKVVLKTEVERGFVSLIQQLIFCEDRFYHYRAV